MNDNFVVMVPSPAQASQRPPFTLNENLDGLYPRASEAGRRANTLRMLS